VLAAAVVVAAVSWFVLRRLYGGQGAQVQLDVIRTAGTLVIGIGGAVALLLTARRQRYTELALVHTDRDATERRITELYTKAADQLGSDQAPVRLAGLYALERLAHSAVEHRQSIVDVICAYLRMPYTPPPPRSYRSPGPARRRRVRPLSDRPAYATPTSPGSRHEQAEQERQVRLTAQNLLSRNLRVATQRRRRWWHRTPPPAIPAWPGLRLDLNGAYLLDFALPECQLDYVDFKYAQFTPGVDFGDAQFTNGASFWGAQFTGENCAWASFKGARFTGEALFSYAQFTGMASFEDAQFTGEALFRGVQFTGGVSFEDVQFTGVASSENAQFTDDASFEGTQFTDWAANFEGARVASTAEPDTVWPPGWTTRPAQPDSGEDPAFLYLTRVEYGNPPDT